MPVTTATPYTEADAHSKAIKKELDLVHDDSADLSIDDICSRFGKLLSYKVLDVIHQHEVDVYTKVAENNSLENKNKTLEEENKSLENKNKTLEEENKSLQQEIKRLEEKSNTLEEIRDGKMCPVCFARYGVAYPYKKFEKGSSVIGHLHRSHDLAHAKYKLGAAAV